MKLNIKFYLLLIILLVSCYPATSGQDIEETIAAGLFLTQQAKPTETPIPEPSPTVDYQPEKDLFADTTSISNENSRCSLKWKGDLVIISCELINYMIPPVDHGIAHFNILKALASFKPLVSTKNLFNENTVFEILTYSKVNGSENLSKTSYSTFLKIKNGTITREIEWASEAEITKND